MFEELMNLVQQHGQDAVVNNAAVPNEHNNAVMQEAGSSIVSGLQSALAGGGLSQIMSMVTGGANNIGSNPITSAISSTFTNSIMQKFGLGNSAASGIAASLIPNVLGGLMSKGNSAGGLSSILGALTGGSQAAGQQQASGGLMDMISHVLGGGDAAAHPQAAAVAQQAQAAQQQQGGGLMDMLGGLLSGK